MWKQRDRILTEVLQIPSALIKLTPQILPKYSTVAELRAATHLQLRRNSGATQRVAELSELQYELQPSCSWVAWKTLGFSMFFKGWVALSCSPCPVNLISAGPESTFTIESSSWQSRVGSHSHNNFNNVSTGIGLDLGIGCRNLLTITAAGENAHDIYEKS